MSRLDINISADGLRDIALALGLSDDEFNRVSQKAITTTTRTLQRLGLSRIAKKIGANTAAFRRRGRVIAPRKGKVGVVWFGLDAVSLSAFSASSVRQIPKGFRIKKLGQSVWQRSPASLSATYESRDAGFKRPNGQADTIQKIYRRIAEEGGEIVDQLDDEADELLRKNFTREIDQVFRRKRHAK